jgi:hypothetical protein
MCEGLEVGLGSGLWTGPGQGLDSFGGDLGNFQRNWVRITFIYAVGLGFAFGFGSASFSLHYPVLSLQ